jgi:tRNA(fMet)-specific endonuclease VapC
MLDTNIVSDIIRNPAGKSAARLREVGDYGLAVSIITAAELRFGAAKSGSPRLLSRIETLLQALDVLPFDVPADASGSNWRLQESRLGQTIS